jgi:hypothetical protein
LTNIDDILADYTDYELSVFYNFRLKEYLSSTQDKIKNYIFNIRGLTDESIEYYLSKMKDVPGRDELVRCPRCKSSKLQKDLVDESGSDFKPEWKDPSKSYSVWLEIKTGELDKYSKVSCVVCGHILYDKNEEEKFSGRNFLKTLLNIPFGKLFRH